MNEFSEYWALSTEHCSQKRVYMESPLLNQVNFKSDYIFFKYVNRIECLLKFFCKIKLIEGKNYDVKRNSFERAMKLNQINQDTKYAKNTTLWEKKSVKINEIPPEFYFMKIIELLFYEFFSFKLPTWRTTVK